MKKKTPKSFNGKHFSFKTGGQATSRGGLAKGRESVASRER